MTDQVTATIVESSSEAAAIDERLFVVWFDLHAGIGTPDWWWEKPGPQPLPGALRLAAELRAKHWVCRVCPAWFNPRPDGRWDNP